MLKSLRISYTFLADLLPQFSLCLKHLQPVFSKPFRMANKAHSNKHIVNKILHRLSATTPALEYLISSEAMPGGWCSSPGGIDSCWNGYQLIALNKLAAALAKYRNQTRLRPLPLSIPFGWFILSTDYTQG
ncbi:hypothetical protein NPIL_216531 [Nephila pilipes]|uniref:Uncharacterized protein n=1 Tax=Nephila pilipes TaxID=299642 RepID=A0A8X6TBP7_NEPPI|nr:hypothetical protein NPIL_216531 [Nephila pilipes]